MTGSRRPITDRPLHFGNLPYCHSRCIRVIVKVAARGRPRGGEAAPHLRLQPDGGLVRPSLDLHHLLHQLCRFGFVRLDPARRGRSRHTILGQPRGLPGADQEKCIEERRGVGLHRSRRCETRRPRYWATRAAKGGRTVGTRYLGRLRNNLRRHSLTHPTWNTLERFRGGFAVKI